MDNSDYIKEMNIQHAKNIAEFEIGDILLDTTNIKIECHITNKSLSSIEVFIPKSMKILDKDGRCKGVDGKNWFTMGDFNKRFKKK